MDASNITIFLEPSTIINYEKSSSSTHRIRLFFANGKRMDIGCKEQTYYYIDCNKTRRSNYFNSLNLEQWTKLYARTPCRFLFESILLNGKYPDLTQNINLYNSVIKDIKESD